MSNQSMEAEALNKTLCILMNPKWSELNNLRSRIKEYLKVNSLTSKQIDTLEMVACELAENAIKYGDYKNEEEKNIEVTVEINNSNVIIEIKNKIIPDDKNLKIFDARIQWIRSFQNPFQAYVERMKFVSGKPMRDNESGLGLTRIAYEGHSILDFFLDENQVLAVSAVYKIHN